MSAPSSAVKGVSSPASSSSSSATITPTAFSKTLPATSTPAILPPAPTLNSFESNSTDPSSLNGEDLEETEEGVYGDERQVEDDVITSKRRAYSAAIHAWTEVQWEQTRREMDSRDETSNEHAVVDQ